ncbi:MAG TPA: LamG domain-containing protein [Kofleriaceae bacterium]|nr:LamG domain-containing protein [Kofleriaceae bacterium]
MLAKFLSLPVMAVVVSVGGGDAGPVSRESGPGGVAPAARALDLPSGLCSEAETPLLHQRFDDAGAPGVVGGALDMRHEVIDLGSGEAYDDLPALTVCAWARPRSYPGDYPTILDKSDDSFVGGWSFYLHSRGTFGLLTNHRQWAEGQRVELGTWQHLCATWDGSPGAAGIALYRNGAAVAQWEAGSNGDVVDIDADNRLLVGRVNDGNFQYDGGLDDVRLYRRVLTPAEIARLHDCSYLPGAL